MDRQRHSEPAQPAPDPGFTLIELLIVIAILGIVSTIVVLSVRGITDKGTRSACQSDDRTLRTAYELYSAKGTPAFNGSGSFEDFLVVQGFLAGASSMYDLASDGTITATVAGGCATGSSVASGPAASGVTAGSPGSWLPSGATPPANLAALVTSNVVPALPPSWGIDQWVVLGDGAPVTWGGSSLGWLPATASDATVGSPGTWLPSGAAPFPDFQALATSGILLDQPAWPPEAYLLLGDSTPVTWDGTSWHLLA